MANDDEIRRDTNPDGNDLPAAEEFADTAQSRISSLLKFRTLAAGMADYNLAQFLAKGGISWPVLNLQPQTPVSYMPFSKEKSSQ